MSRPRIAIIASIGLMVLVVAGYFDLGSAQASHWHTRTAVQLKQLQAIILTADANYDEMPPTFAALIWDYFSPELLFTYRSERSPADVHIGNTSLQALLDLPWDEARSLVFGMEATESEWELVGDFLLSQSIWRDNDPPPNLVEVISVTCPFHKAHRATIDANHTVEFVVGTAWISTQNQLRSELGLSPIPELP